MFFRFRLFRRPSNLLLLFDTSFLYSGRVNRSVPSQGGTCSTRRCVSHVCPSTTPTEIHVCTVSFLRGRGPMRTTQEKDPRKHLHKKGSFIFGLGIINMADTFLFTSESVNEGHPGTSVSLRSRIRTHCCCVGTCALPLCLIVDHSLIMNSSVLSLSLFHQ